MLRSAQLAGYAERYGAGIGHVMAATAEMVGPVASHFPVTKKADPTATPWAARYLRCDDSASTLQCTTENMYTDQDKYNSRCWVERNDFTPRVKQNSVKTPHHASWHPGWREHLYKGRLITFVLLSALEHGLEGMSRVTREEGVPYDGSNWHMEGVHEEVRSRLRKEMEEMGESAPPGGECFEAINFKSVQVLQSLNETNGTRLGGGQVLPHHGRSIARIICGRKMNCRTDYTPRADPERNLRGIVVDVPEGMEKNLLLGEEEYGGGDVAIEGQKVPEGEVDVVGLVTGGSGIGLASPTDSAGNHSAQIPKPTAPGTDPKFWRLAKSMVGTCDGTKCTSCGRNADSNCLLYGRNDAEVYIVGNKNTGPIKFEIPVERGGRAVEVSERGGV